MGAEVNREPEMRKLEQTLADIDETLDALAERRSGLHEWREDVERKLEALRVP